MWQEIQQGIYLEFSDLADITDTTRLVTRLLLAGLLGSFIGLQRELVGKWAGLRTQMLVCIGTAFVITTGERSGMNPDSLSRIIQGLMAGIGFLGSGTILKFEQEDRIEGLTTAATIWFTAAIGIAVGLGREMSAVLATIFALIVLTLLPRNLKK